MNQIINKNNLKSFCYFNETEVKGKVKGIVVEFRGLNANGMFSEYPNGKKYGDLGIIYIIPYLNPWNWMNKTAIIETDEIIDAIKEKYGLDDVPVVYTGCSMGGLGCLVYTRYAKVTPVACVANCPVCDLPYHYTERPDLPRTLYSAYYDSSVDRTLEEVLEDYSPLHLAIKKEMPKVKYSIFHCMADNQVNIHSHSEKLVNALSSYADVKFVKVPDRNHCDLTPEAWEEYHKRIMDAILK